MNKLLFFITLSLFSLAQLAMEGDDANSEAQEETGTIVITPSCRSFLPLGMEADEANSQSQDASSESQDDDSNWEEVLLIKNVAILKDHTKREYQQKTNKCFEGALLINLSFAGDNLSNANFAKAELQKVTLHNAYLFEADFNKAKILKIDLSKAICRRANFNEAILTCSNFTEADLGKADFSDADLTGVTLLNARVDNTLFCGAYFFNSDQIVTVDLAWLKKAGAVWNPTTPPIFN